MNMVAFNQAMPLTTSGTKKVKHLAVAAAVASFAVPMAASATPMGLYYGPSIDFSTTNAQLSCIQYLDGVGCSAPLLNRLSGLPEKQLDTDATPGYVLASPQGALKKDVTLLTGGQAAVPNSDTDPTNPPFANGSQVQDGFKSNSNDPYQATGKASGTGLQSFQTDIAAGNLTPPVPPSNNLGSLDGTTVADKTGTWDVGLDWLIKALTYDTASGGTARGQLMIGFDYNNPQASDPANSMNYWSLITVRDTSGQKQDINFEFRGPGTSLFSQGGFVQDTTTVRHTWDSKPDATDFSAVNLITCYKTGTDGTHVGDIIPMVGGTCAAGYETLHNANGNESTEILGLIPTLDQNLESYLTQGYDVISARVLLGCFDSSAGGYLNSGATTLCGNGGTSDIFLVAGTNPAQPPELPEPGSLSLLGLAMGGLGLAGRRRKSQRA